MPGPRTWESKSAMVDHLDAAKGRSLVIGRDAEAPRLFASFAFTSAHGPREIGIISSGIGAQLRATLIAGGSVILIGHDCSITWIDVESLALLASRDLGGRFVEILAVDREDHVVVIHELGALRVDARGTVIWSFETPDVVEDFGVDAQGNLIMSAMDRTRHAVSLLTGARSS